MTAVEFIRQEFLEKITNENYKKSFDQIIEQAKEIEKDQIMDAYKADLYPCSDEDAEQYYNQTFKSE